MRLYGRKCHQIYNTIVTAIAQPLPIRFLSNFQRIFFMMSFITCASFKFIGEGVYTQIAAELDHDDIANSAAILLALSNDNLRDLGVIYHRRVRLTRSNAPRVRSTRTRVVIDQFMYIGWVYLTHLPANTAG